MKGCADWFQWYAVSVKVVEESAKEMENGELVIENQETGNSLAAPSSPLVINPRIWYSADCKVFQNWVFGQVDEKNGWETDIERIAGEQPIVSRKPGFLQKQTTEINYWNTPII